MYDFTICHPEPPEAPDREAGSAGGRRRISRFAARAEPRWDSTQFGKLEILRRPPASSPSAPRLRQPQDDSRAASRPAGLRECESLQRFIDRFRHANRQLNRRETVFTAYERPRARADAFDERFQLGAQR